MDAAQLERLAMAAEEGGEIGKAVGKAIRFGPDSRFPADGSTNMEQLRAEMADLIAVSWMMAAAGDIAPISEDEVLTAIARKMAHARHQDELVVSLGECGIEVPS